ncbi:hypothetical protein FA15DRAFT_756898 [Coprinopsis marcescibilis]|uniref:SAP domain-containing protein n=1 Tax=Coprinopsis marcescibilis TaxID=230819 RepID=A0A5C3KTL9_COPMA|nr:hypothetical protein FA15DRAFT_756898 [Coprinopsis marcescibilis]
MAHELSPLDQVQRAYLKFTHSELVLFLKVRNLPISGAEHELAFRLANHDLHTYHFPAACHNARRSSSPSRPSPTFSKTFAKFRSHMSPDLPVEIIADILDQVGDWELTRAIGVPTSLPRPTDWSRATSTDEACLRGDVHAVRRAKPNATSNCLTKLGAVSIIRFGYVKILEYFLSNHHKMFLSAFENDLIPIKASRYGRTEVLSWWKHGFESHPDLVPAPEATSISESIDGASRSGQVASLDWWLNQGPSFEYTEAALEYASAKNQIAVLDWWKEQNKGKGLPLKIGRVMDMASRAGNVEVLEWWATSQLDFKHDRHALQHASCHGKVEVLQWWLGSGLQLHFDQEVLTGATRHNRPEVLEWWDASGLPVQYRMCDIEEALEDAIGGGDAAGAWWKAKGVDFNANDKEWMKLQSLN